MRFMDFKNYFYELKPLERKALATKVKTSVGHLTNCAYGYSKFSPILAMAIETETKIVTRADMRPTDAHLIWPDIAAKKKARKMILNKEVQRTTNTLGG